MKKTKLVWLILIITLTAFSYAGAESLKVKDGYIEFKFDGTPLSKYKSGSFTNDQLVTCGKKLGGVFEIIDSYRARMYPSAKPAVGVNYTCTPDKKYISDKAALKNRFSFKVSSFALVNASAKYDEKDAIIRLVFNDVVKFSDFKRRIKLYEVLNRTSNPVKFEIYPQSNSNIYILNTTGNLGKGSVKYELAGGVESINSAPLKAHQMTFYKESKKPIDKNKNDFVILDKPRAIANNDGTISLRLYLPEGLTSSDPSKYINVSPKTDVTVSSSRWVYYNEKRKYKLNSRRFVDIRGDFNASTLYELSLLPGLETRTDVLKKRVKFDIATPDRKPFVIFTSDKMYVSRKAEGIEVNFTNLNELKVVVEKLTSDNYRYFLNFAGGKYDIYRYASVVFDKKVILDGKKNKFEKRLLRLDDFMGSLDNGVYNIKLISDKIAESKLLVVTDIGISAKVSGNQVFVSANSLSKAEPVSSARVYLYSSKNELLSKGSTNRDGVYVYSYSNLIKKKPYSVIVEKGDDKSYLVLRNDNKKHGYIPGDLNPYKAYVFLERELLRPGDSVNFMVSVKDREFKSLSEVPVKLKISDPSGKTVFEKSIKTDGLGTLEQKIEIPYQFRTGRYRIYVTLNKVSIGYKTFSVEDFIPHRIESGVKVEKNRYPAGANIKATVSARFLFGAPGKGLKANAKLYASDKTYASDKFKGFRFSGTASVSSKSFRNSQKTFYLDDKGKAEVVFNTSTPAKPASILEGRLTATVFDDGRGVSKTDYFDIYPYKTMAGVKKADDKKIEQGKEVVFSTVMIDPQKEAAVDGRLRVKILRTEWYYNYVSMGSGWRYKWNKKDITVKAFYVKAGENFEFRPKDAGDYRVVVEDEISGHNSVISFYVSGWSYSSVGPSQNVTKIKVDFEDKEYKKGDELDIDINSPFPGRLLVTLESDGVKSYRSLELKGNTANIKMPVGFDTGHGFYVHAYLVRSTDVDDRLMPYRALGYKYAKPDRKRNKVKVKLVTPENVESGTGQKIIINTNSPNAKAAVAVVDVGILNIIGTYNPDPFSFFMVKENLSVLLYDFYNQIMTHLIKGKPLAFGGDMMAEAKSMAKRAKHLAPEPMNKRVKPFSVWSGIITLDKTGKGEFPLNIPNFNGSARVMAVVIGQHAVGAASKDIIIKDKVIIKPTYPRYVNAGDELEIPVRVFNNTEKPAVLKLKAMTIGGVKVEGLAETVNIKAEDSKLLKMRMKVLHVGEAKVKISTNYGARQYYHEVDLPVRTAKLFKTESFRGESEKPMKFEVPKWLGKETKPLVEISLSDNLLAQMKDTIENLIGYPYGCAEQTSSKLFTMMNMDRALDMGSKKGRYLMGKKKVFIQEGVLKLISMMRSSGEINYWPNGKYVNGYASVYAIDALLEARKRGYDIPDGAYDRMINVLTKIARRNIRYTNNDEDFIRMYAVYLLHLEKKLPANILNSVYDSRLYERNIVTKYMMAAILNKGRNRSRLLKEIESFDFASMDDIRYYGGEFYSKLRNMSFALMLHSRHFDKNFVSSALFTEIADYVGGKRLYSTQENAFVLRALSEYYKNTPDNPVRAEVMINSKKYDVKGKTYLSFELEGRSFTIKPVKSSVTYAVDISGYKKMPVNISGKGKKDKTGRFLSIDRTFVDENGKKIDLNKVKAGQLIFSKIKVNAFKNIENLAVVNRVPSCLEIVNTRLYKSPSKSVLKNKKYFPDYVDIRDDKVISFINLNGETVFYRPMTAVTNGKCVMTPALVEAMYDTRLNDYSLEVETIKIVE